MNQLPLALASGFEGVGILWGFSLIDSDRIGPVGLKPGTYGITASHQLKLEAIDEKIVLFLIMSKSAVVIKATFARMLKLAFNTMNQLPLALASGFEGAGILWGFSLIDSDRIGPVGLKPGTYGITAFHQLKLEAIDEKLVLFLIIANQL